ncbi:MAG: DUF368 domain-containing protein [Bacteroidetes bacterium]|nr:DUF368 domain-containing protein [Bacteroidota bacterium]
MNAKKRSIWSYLIVGLKGLCMGAADTVPGVSGGTIAFVTGIYVELLDSIRSINLSVCSLLIKGQLSAFWKQLNGWFLFTLLCGILASIYSLANLMRYLLQTHPLPVWSFFTGLVVASAIYILKDLKNWKVPGVLALLVGVGLGILVCTLSPTQTPDGYGFIFLTGAIAICAMILPGISGSFIMVLLGKYAFIMEAVSGLYWDVLLVFASGALIGIISFSHFLSWVLKKYYSQTVCLLAGFMFGSVAKIWPAKHFTHTGLASQISLAALFILIGFIMVFGIEFLAKRMRRAG